MKNIIGNIWAVSRTGTRVGNAIHPLRGGLVAMRSWLDDAETAINHPNLGQPGWTTARDAAAVAFRTHDDNEIDLALNRTAQMITAIRLGVYTGRVEIVDLSHGMHFENTIGLGCTAGYVNTGVFGFNPGRIHISFKAMKRARHINPAHAELSAAWILLHEATHKFGRTKDKAYTLSPRFWTLSFQRAMRNADSFTLCIYLAANPSQGQIVEQPHRLPFLW